MKHLIVTTLLVVVCSLYYFPVTLVALPLFNSKMIVAVAGLLFFVWDHIVQGAPAIRKDMAPVLTLGLLFSLSSYFSVVSNSTDDYVFATYFLSMCVWLGGAYCVVSLLRRVYGTVTASTVFHYMALLCAAQCVLAVMIDNIPVLRVFVEDVFGTNSEYFEETSRLYGIGASYDTAGIRFSCALLGLGYLIKNSPSLSKRNFYILLLIIIGAVGNMMSRTTIVGLVIALAYLMPSIVTWARVNITGRHLLWITGLGLMLVVLFFAGTYMYNNMAGVRSAFDYGFEGFINYYRTGSFSTHSSDMLLSHIFDIHPDNTRTWLIGDGYFEDPYAPGAFYMGTDMGYIRFIFYCGVLGLAWFVSYFICCTYTLCRRCSNMTYFFICLLLIQLVVWVKIPTDIFCFYALLLLADTGQAETETESTPALCEPARLG